MHYFYRISQYYKKSSLIFFEVVAIGWVAANVFAYDIFSDCEYILFNYLIKCQD